MKEAEIKAKELVDSFRIVSYGKYSLPTKKKAIQCAIICVERNIKSFTDLVNDMEYFSNESRQLIWQLIDDEQEVLTNLKEM